MPSLDLTPADFRRLADRITQHCVDLLTESGDSPVMPITSGGRTSELFREPLPEQGMGEKAFGAITDLLAHSRPPSSRFFAYVFGSGEPVAALGDYLASVLNQNATAWRSAPAAITVERTVVDWLAQAIGCPGFGGSLCGGGSAANLMGLAIAREAKLPANERGARPGMVYASREVHMSIPKAVALLGLGRENLRLAAVDGQLRMDVAALEGAILQDKAAGRIPMAIVACAGTVNTGAVDPLAAVAEVAARHQLWLHVDGAYGALAAIAEPALFAGLNRADSISLDPHKWLYQPADCGCLLYRDPGWARVAFSHTGEYARALTEDPVEGFAVFEESMELSRRFRALKLWLSLRYHGMSAFRDAVRNDIVHARRLETLVRDCPALELLGSGPLSAVCFRYVGGAEGVPRLEGEATLEQVNSAILRHVVRERRRVYLSNAKLPPPPKTGCAGGLEDRFALRACFVNHRTKPSDVDLIVEEVLRAGKTVVGPRPSVVGRKNHR